MRFIYNIFIILIVSSFLFSCGGFKLKKKADSGEEFVIEKKDPLILPPDLDKIPEPGSITSSKSNEEDTFKEILNESKKETIKSKKSTSIEEEILRRLPK